MMMMMMLMPRYLLWLPLLQPHSLSRTHPLTADSNEFNVDLETQQVLIWGANLPPFEEVEEKLAKTGKPVCVLPSF